jgi:urease accessory protein
MGGDHFTTTVHVGDGASLSVGSVAATYARPGADGETSTAGVAAHVGSAGRLRWAPEPLVAVVGCRHRTETTIELGDGARLFWVDVTVLGRHGEDGGEVRSRRSVDLSGRPLNRQELSMGGADRRAHDPAVLGGARVVASCLVVHPEWERTDRDHPVTGPAPGEAARDTLTEVSPLARAGVLRLAGPGVEILGLGTTLASVLDTWAVLAERLSVLAPDTAQALTGYVEGSR